MILLAPPLFLLVLFVVAALRGSTGRCPHGGTAAARLCVQCERKVPA